MNVTIAVALILKSFPPPLDGPGTGKKKKKQKFWTLATESDFTNDNNTRGCARRRRANISWALRVETIWSRVPPAPIPYCTRFFFPFFLTRRRRSKSADLIMAGKLKTRKIIVRGPTGEHYVTYVYGRCTLPIPATYVVREGNQLPTVRAIRFVLTRVRRPT